MHVVPQVEEVHQHKPLSSSIYHTTLQPTNYPLGMPADTVSLEERVVDVGMAIEA